MAPPRSCCRRPRSTARSRGGLVDGAAWPTFGLSTYRWYEVAKFLLRPSFGTMSQLIFANKATWDRMPAKDKDIILKAIVKFEDNYVQIHDKLTLDEEKELQSRGVSIVQMGDAQKAKLPSA